jgi:hypothetical protein
MTFKFDYSNSVIKDDEKPQFEKIAETKLEEIKNGKKLSSGKIIKSIGPIVGYDATAELENDTVTISAHAKTRF